MAMVAIGITAFQRARYNTIRKWILGVAPHSDNARLLVGVAGTILVLLGILVLFAALFRLDCG